MHSEWGRPMPRGQSQSTASVSTAETLTELRERDAR
jgi:hypothetical protein